MHLILVDFPNVKHQVNAHSVFIFHLAQFLAFLDYKVSFHSILCIHYRFT